MFISVVIPTYNRLPILQKCLLALEQQHVAEPISRYEVVLVDNGSGVTGTAVTLVQATNVAAGGAKALPFTKVWVNADISATDTLVETAVSNNTFTTATTSDTNLLYVIDIDPATLDIDNGFDCVRVGTGNAVNAVTCVLYILWDAKYAAATPPSAILD